MSTPKDTPCADAPGTPVSPLTYDFLVQRKGRMNFTLDGVLKVNIGKLKKN